VGRIKLILLGAKMAKQTWDNLPPEHRTRLVEGAKTTVKTHGPMVAKKVADTTRMYGPVVAKKASDAAAKAVEIAKARKGP
jgi:hypothetical protein